MAEIHDALAAISDEERKYVLARSYPLFAAYYGEFVMTDFHAQIAAHWSEHRYSLTLVPMQHGKSTTMKWDIIRNICLNPNVRIILTTATHDDAQEYVRSIESELTTNQQLIADFGPFYNAARWTSTGFRVIGCQHSNPHDTLETFGAGTWNQKGHGCEIVYVDDIVTEETCLTPEARAKQRRYFNMAVASGPRAMWPIDKRYGLQVPKGIDWPMDAPYNPRPGMDVEYGQVIVMGTCFDPHDLYDDLRNNPDSLYTTLYLDCFWDHALQQPDQTEAQALWPEVWPVERLVALRGDWGLLDFDKRMRNRARNPSEIVFQREWFDGDDDHPGCLNENRSFGELPRDHENKVIDLYKVLGFDPASGEASKFAAWPTYDLLGFPREGDPEQDRRYIIDVFRAQVGPEWLIDILLDGNPDIPHPGFYAKYKYDVCKAETNGFAPLLLNHHRLNEARRRGVMIEGHHTGRNKLDPIQGVKSMEAIFRDGLVDIPYKTDRDKKLAKEIIDQFVNFSFDRAGRKKSLTDYVMAFWFAELAIRKLRESHTAYRHSTSPYVVKNPYFANYRKDSKSTAKLVGRR